MIFGLYAIWLTINIQQGYKNNDLVTAAFYGNTFKPHQTLHALFGVKFYSE